MSRPATHWRPAGGGLLLALALPAPAGAQPRGPAGDPAALQQAGDALPAAQREAGCPGGPPGQPLGLAEALARSLCQSPRLRGSAALIRQRRAEQDVVAASRGPTVQATLQATDTRQRYREPALGTTARTAGMSLQLQWVLLDSGRRSGRAQQARALLAAAQAGQDQALRSELLETARSYHQAQAGDALLQAARESEQIAQGTAERLQARLAGGAAGRTELLQARAAGSRATLARLDAAASAQAARGELARRLGLPARSPLQLPPLDPGPAERARAEALQPLIDAGLQQHPQLQAAEAEVEAARGRLRSAQAEDGPVLSLNAQQTSQQPPNGSLLVVDRVRSAGLLLSVPLYEGGAGRSRQRAAEAELQRSQAAADALREDLERRLWRHAQEARAEAERLQAVEQLVQDSREAEAGLAVRFHAGAGGLFEWLSAQQDLARARREQVAIGLAWHEARLRLAAQLGRLDGWLLGD